MFFGPTTPSKVSFAMRSSDFLQFFFPGNESLQNFALRFQFCMIIFKFTKIFNVLYNRRHAALAPRLTPLCAMALWAGPFVSCERLLETSCPIPRCLAARSSSVLGQRGCLRSPDCCLPFADRLRASEVVLIARHNGGWH